MGAALIVENLSKTYANGVSALGNVSLRIEEGDFFALLGANGAGKSTLLNIISSLTRPSSGSVKIFGHDTRREWFLAKSALGLVPQEINFYQFECVQDIVLNQAGYYGVPRSRAQARATELLQLMGLWEKRKEKARSLSGGMKRRLMIVRALLHQPRLLILDEPTAGVDIDIRRSMWTFLRELNAQGTTIILTTHYLEEAEQLCRNIAIIDKGSIIAHSEMEQLLQRLDKEVLLLEVSQTPTPAPHIRGYRHQWKSEQLLEVEIQRHSGLNHLIQQLTSYGCQLHGVRRQSGRLEELFIAMVKENKELG